MKSSLRSLSFNQGNGAWLKPLPLLKRSLICQASGARPSRHFPSVTLSLLYQRSPPLFLSEGVSSFLFFNLYRSFNHESYINS